MLTIDGREYLIKCPDCDEAAQGAPLFDPLPEAVPADMSRWPTRCGRLEMARCDC